MFRDMKRASRAKKTSPEPRHGFLSRERADAIVAGAQAEWEEKPLDLLPVHILRRVS